MKENVLTSIKHIKPKFFIHLFLYVLLISLSFVFLYPFLYLLVNSLKSPQDVMDTTVSWFLNNLHWNNYTLAIETLDYPSTLLKTILVVVGCTIGHVFACSFVAYGFARFNVRGKNLFFILLLLSIIVPIQTIIIPEFVLYANLGVTNSYFPLIFPTFLGFGLFGGLFVFVYRQFYLSLPRSLEEAAEIDGCGTLATYFRIVLPSSKSPAMVCLVLSLVWHWNDYFEPLIYISNKDQYLLPMLLPSIYSRMFDGSSADTATMENAFTLATVMAATSLIVLPLLLAYIFLQKQFVQGVERSGITGE